MGINEITVQPELSLDVSVTEAAGPQGIQGPTGPTGPTGAVSTVPGPTGPTGAIGHVGTLTTAAYSGSVTPTGVSTTMTLYPYYSILSVECDTSDIRFRVYTDTDSRAADIAREVTVSATTAAGVIAEIVTLNGTVHLAPPANGYTSDNTSTVPVRIDREAGTSTVAITVTYLAFNTE